MKISNKLLSLTLLFFFTLSSCILLTIFYLLPNSNKESSKYIKVHYIDVGQGDSSLIQFNGTNVLIDAGPASSQDKLISYLKDLKIKKIDYVLATHPHEDHIGGLPKIIKNFDIGGFYAPKIIHNSDDFIYLVNELSKNNMKINILKKGMSLPFFDKNQAIKIDVFSPNKDFYDNLNNYSPIIKITYGNTSFLFTGDAEKEVEKDILNNPNLKSSVLKLGHHGSSTSTSSDFFKQVSPLLAIISLGADNKYGHPSKETLSLLDYTKTPYFRTDEDGTIVILSDGKSLIIE